MGYARNITTFAPALPPEVLPGQTLREAFVIATSSVIVLPSDGHRRSKIQRFQRAINWRYPLVMTNIAMV